MSDSFNSYLANLGDVTVEQVPQRDHPASQALDGEPHIEAGGMMDGRQTVNQQEESIVVDGNERRDKTSPHRRDDLEEMRAEGSADDDMELDETIDSRIGMRMESEGQHMRARRSDEEEEGDDSLDAVNLLDSLPLEGAPIEGQEVSEAFLLGKEDDEDEAEEQSSTRSDEGDNLDAGKRLGEHEDDLDPAKKKQKKEDGSDASANDPDSDKKMDKKTANMRRNIREVMDETQLDEATLAAQRQEMERVRRVQEQQRIIREVQRRQTSLLRSNVGVEDESEVRLPSSVQLKVNSNLSTGGQVSVSQQQSALAPRRPMAESCRWPKGSGRGGFQGTQTSLSRVPSSRGVNAQQNVQQRVRMMTPSVSISPVVAKKEPVDEPLEYYTDSDLSDVDIDYADNDEQSMMVDKQMMQARKLSGSGKSEKPAKGKDVVTISSSSESSDDDCIVLSDPSEAEETDNDEDPANSGMHTNDRYNVPDAQNRVLVNVGHPEDEPDVFLAPQIARIIKPHQIGGIRFLYDNIVESIERFKTSAGFGCILAHSMGLGKTLQVACFCDIFFRCTDAKTVLCIMPINTLQNWLAEFNMWLPYEDPNKPKVEEKAIIKEESNQSDLGYMSRQSSEHDSSSQHPPAPTMTPETPTYPPPHPSYNQAYNPYAPASNMYDPRFGTPYPGYKPDPYGIPQYGYPPPTAPTYQDPHAPYPTYGVPYPTYGAPPPPVRTEVPPEVKKENPPAPVDNGQQVKTELKEEPKKESEEPKKDEKDPVTVKTPFSVDAPPDVEIRPRHFALHILNDSHKTMAARARVIREWQKVGGVLLIGYELYRQLSLKKPNKAKRKRGQPFKDPVVEDDDKNKPLLDEMHTALVNPGPDLVICDEGHRIKNSHASISLALKQMRTKRRIVLTGYPLQNNLLEYWCMVDFVRPNYLGTKSEFCNMFERPIQNGQCIDSTPQDIRLMRYRAHVLHSLLEGFVQRRSHAVLQVSLPRKEEYILLVRMTPHQRKLYDTFMNQVVKTRAVPNPLKAFAVCCKIWNHPDVLYHFLKKRQANEEDDLDLEETMAEKAAAAAGIKRTPKARAPKGEGKKGKKASPKNKPAASVQPNSSGMSSIENGEAGEQQGFQNFNAPQPPPPPPPTQQPAQGSAFPQQQQQSQGNYQQPQQAGYQNYQTGEYNNYYGNQNQQSQYPPPSNTNQQQPQSSYPAAANQSQPAPSSYPPPAGNQPQQTQPSSYPPTDNQSQQTPQSYPPTGSQAQPNQQTPYPPPSNQTQQSYPPTGNQSFPPYAQNSSYPPGNQTSQQPSQQYQAQPQQNYGERFPGPSPTGPSPSPSTQNYRPEQSQPAMAAPGSSANYPRPSYPYQGTENTSYQGQSYSQTTSYQNQQQQQQPASSYGSYPAANTQGYGAASSQPVQNYPAGSQQQQPTQQQQQQSQSTTGYQQQQTPQQQPQQQPQSQNTTGYQQQQPQQQASNPPTPNYPQNQQTPGPYSSQAPSAQTTNQQYSSSTAQQQQPYANASTQSYAGSAQPQPQNQQYSSTGAQPNQPYSSTSTTPQSHQPYANSNASQAGQQQQNSSAPMQNQSHSYPGTPSATPNPPPSTPYNSNQTPQQQQQPTTPSHQQQAYQAKGLKGGYQDSTYAQSQLPANSVQQSQFGYPNQPQKQQQQSYQQPSQQPQSQQYQQAPVQQQQQPQTQQYQQQPPAQQTQQQQPQQATQYQQPPVQQAQSQQYQQPPAPQSQQQQPQQYQQQQQPAQQYQQPQQQQPQQSHGYNQQIPAYQPTTSQQPQQTAQQASVGYQQNQAGSTNPPSQTQYGYQSQPSQPVQNYQQQQQQQPTQTIKTEPSYGYPQNGNNYSSASNSTTPNQTPGTQQQQQPATQGQNQYWQGNYQNSSDPYYNQNSNQYPANQYQSQYQNYPTDSKPPQGNQGNAALQQPVPSNPGAPYGNPTPAQNTTEPAKEEDKVGMDQDKDKLLDKDKEDKSDDEIKDEVDKGKCSPSGMPNSINVFKDQEPGIPYDWATELMKGYVPGLIDASAKMTIFFCILEEAILLGDRVLAFSQSLFTLNLIEDFLARNDFKYADGKTESWAKNTNYYRLDGSTSALEREKLINEFNANPKIHLFLVSTRAGSLGINLVGANRAIVFDASWNPCHDTQAVCRVYRYGQQKNCYVYRLVTDNCLERKIYDRQISKQGMSDRVVDQCNPDAHLSLKEATTLNWDWEEDSDPQDFSNAKDKFPDEVMHIVLEKHSTLLTKQPFHHESLLVDRKDKKLSQAEKRLARRGYELEKMAATSSRPSYNYVPGNTAARVSVQSGSIQIRQIRDGPTPKPVASVRPMQQRGAEGLSRNPGGSRWIPAEVWQRQGMSAQEMTLPLDVVIPTNSPDKGSIVLKAGQRVMVLKSPKGIYMQLESGKIIAIRTALKVTPGGKKDEEPAKKGVTPTPQRNNANKGEVSFPLRNNSAISIIPKSSTSSAPIQPSRPMAVRTGVNYRPFGEKEVVNRRKTVATAAAKPYNSSFNPSHQVSVSRINKSKHDDMGNDNSNSSDGHKVRPEQRVEEVRIEDVVSEKGSNSDYSPASSRFSNSDTDTNMPRPLMEVKRHPHFPLDNNPSARMHGMQHQAAPYATAEPKINVPRKLEQMNRQQERKSGVDGSDDVIIDDPSKRLHQPYQPYQQQPTRPQPRAAAAPRGAETGKPTPTPAVGKPTNEMESQPLSGYPYAQYPRYYDYADPRTRPLGDPYGSYYPPAAAKPVEDKQPKSNSAEAASFSRPTKETAQPVKPADTTSASSSSGSSAPAREDPHGPTAFSHPSSVRPAYPPGPYPPYDPYAQHYPAPAGSAAYSAGAAAAAAATYPAYGTPSYNADYARMYPAFPPPPPPTAADPYRSYGPPPPPSAAGPPSNYYAPFPHPPPPPYPNYSFLPPYPNPGVPAEPQPPAP